MGRRTSIYVKGLKQSPLSPVKYFKRKYILKYYLHGFERERREKIQQRLCYINAAKICNSGQGSAFDRGRRGKKLIDFCLIFQSSSLRIACYAGELYIYV
jgi:hypothetical protein